MWPGLPLAYVQLDEAVLLGGQIRQGAHLLLGKTSQWVGDSVVIEWIGCAHWESP